MPKGRPIKLRCDPLLTPGEFKQLSPALKRLFRSERLCSYRQRGRFRIARFRSRQDRHEFALVHPSTKSPGKCQVSFFDREGPYSDRQYATCSSAVDDLKPWYWKLDEVKR